MNKKISGISTVILIIGFIVLGVFYLPQTRANPIEITMGVETTKDYFDKGFIDSAYERFNSKYVQGGGDHSLYYLSNFASMMRTDMSMPHPEYKELKYNLNSDIGGIEVRTESEGVLKLEEYMKNPHFRTQGLLMLHEGQVVYENYPGMNPQDMHWWASASKSVTGLLMSQLVIEGLVDSERPITDYVPKLKRTSWDSVSVQNVINHSSGLDLEETGEALFNPKSAFLKFAYTAIGTTDPHVDTDEWFDILKKVKPLKGESPGEHFRYSSLNTQVLGLLIENVSNKQWSDVVEERIWGHLHARMPLQTHKSPDGQALNFGMISSTLQDMGRFALLFSPSWDKVATEQVVSADIIDMIRASGSEEAFKGSAKEAQAKSLFGDDMPTKGGYQFDFIFEDGAMYKHGNMGQGIYIDPERDFVAVYFSITPYSPPYGEIKVPSYIRAAARMLSDN